MRRSANPILTGPATIVTAGLVAVAFLGPAPRAAENDKPAAYEATRMRPLFSPTRRPPPPPAAVPAFVVPPAVVIAPPVVTAPDLAVSGVIVGTDTRVAIVKRPNDTAFTRLTPGSKIDGWTVSNIEPRAIVLKRDDRSVTIGMPDPPR